MKTKSGPMCEVRLPPQAYYMSKNRKLRPFCWQCSRPLERHPKTRELVYAVISVGGNDVKVHKCCKNDALKALSLTDVIDPGELTDERFELLVKE